MACPAEWNAESGVQECASLYMYLRNIQNSCVTPFNQKPQWLTALPHLEPLWNDPVTRKLLETAKPVDLPKGTVVFRDGQKCGTYFLLIEGSIRVYNLSEYGREIVLYRIEPGQACVLTTTYLLAKQPFPAEGLAERDSRGVIIPISNFQRGLDQTAEFRRFVFAAYGQRLSELIALVGEVAFGRIDMRLAEFLLKQADGEGALAATHQEIATEFGSAREVVSRQLKDFERNCWVELHRGKVILLESAALQALVIREKPLL